MDSIDGVYIPKDMGDCMRSLYEMHADSTKQQILDMTNSSFRGLAHLGMGMWIRNNWGLWKGSRLKEYFNKKAVERAKKEGRELIFNPHPDNMSGAILSNYYEYLISKRINIQEKIADCTNNICPENTGRLKFYTRITFYDSGSENPTESEGYMAKASKDEVWLYFDLYNWLKVPEKIALKIEMAKKEDRSKIIDKIINGEIDTIL